MNNFIEINSGDNQTFINLNFIESVTHGHSPCIKSTYWIYLINHNVYEIDEEQYEEIKAKLIDNNSKE